MVKIAFGSCSRLKHAPDQPVWSTIQAEKPDLLLMLGDTVYLDDDRIHDPEGLRAALTELFDRQLAEPHFKSLLADMRKRGKPIAATYDDHDFFGEDRCVEQGEELMRLAARDAFVAAFDPPRIGNDIYGVWKLGLVDVLLLDTRFYRANPHVAKDDPDAVLGPAQWRWLLKTFDESDAKFVIVGSSSTFHDFKSEHWERDYEAAAARMAGLMKHRSGALFVSGDIHENAVSDKKGFIEIVSSGFSRHRSWYDPSLINNFGTLTFDDESVQVRLHMLPGSSAEALDFVIRLSDWTLPPRLR